MTIHLAVLVSGSGLQGHTGCESVAVARRTDPNRRVGPNFAATQGVDEAISHPEDRGEGNCAHAVREMQAGEDE